jgi:serine/threonine protein kinase
MGFFVSRKYRGQRLGNYVIEELVGEGRYGLCFLAMADAGQKVIIKKFRPGIFKKNAEKNMYEAVTLSKLKDTRIPELLGVINQESFYGFVLEHKPGNTVKDLLFKHNHIFSDEEFYNIGLRLISIIKYLHENGIVHRDIRIPNVLVDNENVYLIDFGLARFADGNEYKYDLDYSYLGDFFLYLLYSSFQKKEGHKNLPWHKELPLTDKQQMFLKRLMGIEVVYESMDDIETEFIGAFGIKDSSAVNKEIIGIRS